MFQMDPYTCEVISGTYYSVNNGLSQRGVGYDPEFHRIWVGSWNDFYLNQHEAQPPYDQVSANYVGLAIASIAVDEVDDYLFIGTNSYPDYLYCYDITGGTLEELLGSWQVPWQSGTNGYDMAGMCYDDDSGRLVLVNQRTISGEMEAFDFSLEDGLAGAGYCDLDYTTYAWGMALVEDGDPAPGSYYTYNPDITGFSPPFEVDEYGIPRVYPPYDLYCIVSGYWEVHLEWTNAEEYDEVHIYRDGDLIGVLPGDAVEYLDEYVHPGFHRYGVAGMIGIEESGQVRCDVLMGSHDPCFDFNATDGAWTAGGYADWQWGTPSYVIDGNAWETNIGTNYFNNACGWLDSPVIKLGSDGGWLSFDTYDHVDCGYDGWNVQLSTDGGYSWTVILPIFGYDQGVPSGECTEGLGGDTNCGDGEVEVWDFDLTGYPREEVAIRFLFESDPSVVYTGLVVDNVCLYGGSLPWLIVRCRLLNPDMDGDGTGDVHIGDYLYYSATFKNQIGAPLDYGARHSFFAGQSCQDPDSAAVQLGPECKGTLEAYGEITHYFRVRVPDDNRLLEFNPFCVEVSAWECDGDEPLNESGSCCFDVTLLPAWEPPPVPEPLDGFVVEEIDALPVNLRPSSP